MLLCDQLSAYLATWVPDAAVAPAAGAPDAGAAPHSNGQTVAPPAKRAVEAPTAKMLVSKKNQADEEMYVVGGKAGKGGKGARNGGASAAGPSSSSAPQQPSAPPPTQRLTHSLDALASFTKVSLVPPATVGEVAKAKGDVAAKKAKYLDQRVAALAKQAAQRAAREAAEAEGKEYVAPPEEGAAQAAPPPTEAAVQPQVAPEEAAPGTPEVKHTEGAAPEAAKAVEDAAQPAAAAAAAAAGDDGAEAAPRDARVSLSLSVPEEDRVSVDMVILV